MRVYRVENEKHVGPFNAEVPGCPHELQQLMAIMGEDVPMLIEDIVEDARQHKEVTIKEMKRVMKLGSPAHDGLDKIKKDEVCGAASLDQLREWFPVGLDRAMADHHQKIHCYEVPDEDVRKGGHQVVFKRRRAKEVPLDGTPTDH